MPIRNIIRIDEEKCTGCGQCIVDCAEGALAIIDGKAKLIKENFCDGLGACIGNCPTGALTLEEREAPEFELPPEMAHAAAAATTGATHAPAPVRPCPSSLPGHSAHTAPSGGCPGSRARQFQRQEPEQAAPTADAPSALGHWPVQLHLVNFGAPHFQGADILIAADCSAFACGSFHPRLLKGKAVAIACPKLDDPSGYMEKLVAMFQQARPKSVTVVRMEVPCCRGITQWVVSARSQAGSGVAVEEVILGVEGAVIARNTYAN
ncbi:MAG: 4Fe-4S binding protein [Candidatus Hydrogenedentes bacterium]|jgi:NAD-dependent dihydropyrimidine dehydrogenase PreA subunit|nr:4Fe-4S binding protein [Candidatus Hydrogenedentota bacterium]